MRAFKYIKSLYHFQGLYEISLQGYAVVVIDYAGLGVENDAIGKVIVYKYLIGLA